MSKIPNLYHPFFSGNVSFRSCSVKTWSCELFSWTNVKSTCQWRSFPSILLTNSIRKMECIEKRISSSSLKLLKSPTLANIDEDIDGSIVIWNKISIRLGSRWLPSAKAKDTSRLRLVDKKLLNDNNPPCASFKLLKSSRDKPWPRYTTNGFLLEGPEYCCKWSFAIWLWRSRTKNPNLIIRSTSIKRNALLSMVYKRRE